MGSAGLNQKNKSKGFSFAFITSSFRKNVVHNKIDGEIWCEKQINIVIKIDLTTAMFSQ